MKGIVVALISLLLLGGAGAAALADVTGDIELRLGLFPDNLDTEAVEYDIDFEVLSDIDFTVSGLTIGNRFALGVTGLEHYILTVRGTLGAMDVLDEIVFATPFSNQVPSDIDDDGVPNTSDADIDGDGTDNLSDSTPFGSFEVFIKDDIDNDGVPNAVDPDVDGDGTPNGIDTTPFGFNFTVSPLIRPIGETLFVKKRVTMNLNIAGVTLTNLAIFEDVNFTHPFSGSVQSYGAEMQEFRFGDILTLMGQTVSGINIRSVTGIGADPNVPNIIKKASFSGSICEEPENFGFCVEQLFIDNVPIGPVTLSSLSEFRVIPLTLCQTFTARYADFLNLLDLSGSFRWHCNVENPLLSVINTDVDEIVAALDANTIPSELEVFVQKDEEDDLSDAVVEKLGPKSWKIVNNGKKILVRKENGDLKIFEDLGELIPLTASIFVDAAPVTINFNLNSKFMLSSVLARAQFSIDNASFTTSLVFLPGTGLSNMNLTARISNLSGLNLFATTTLSNPGTGPGGGFGSHSTTFTVSGNIVPTLSVNSTIGFTQDGLSTATARITFKF